MFDMLLRFKITAS